MYLLMTAASPTSALPGPAARQHQHQAPPQATGLNIPAHTVVTITRLTHDLLMGVAKQA